jgi:hypothetical protein
MTKSRQRTKSRRKMSKRFLKRLKKYERRLARLGDQIETMETQDFLLEDFHAFQLLCMDVLSDLTREADRLALRIKKLEKR